MYFVGHSLAICVQNVNNLCYHPIKVLKWPPSNSDDHGKREPIMTTSKSNASTSLGKAALGLPGEMSEADIALFRKATESLESDIEILLAKNAQLLKLIGENAAVQQNKTPASFKEIEIKIATALDEYGAKLNDVNQLMTKIALLTGSAKVDSAVLSRLKESLNLEIKRLLERNESLRHQRKNIASPEETTPKKPRR